MPTFGGASVDEPVFAGLPRGLAEAFGAEDDVDGVGGVVPVEEAPGRSARNGADRLAAIALASNFGVCATAPDDDDSWEAALADAEMAALFEEALFGVAALACSLSQLCTSS